MCRNDDNCTSSAFVAAAGHNKMQPPSLHNTAKNAQEQPTSSSSSSRANSGDAAVRNGRRRRCSIRGMLLFSLLVTMLIAIYDNSKVFCSNGSDRCLFENIGTYYYTRKSGSLIVSSLVVAMQQQHHQQQPPEILSTVVLPPPPPPPPPPTNIPRTIFLFWELGFPTVKLEVQMVYQSWAFFNPTFTIKTLNGTEADLLSERRQFIPDDVWSKTTVQARSDVYRVLLLYQHGGVWVDASLFCNQPLEAWLDLNSTELVAFRRTDNLGEQKLKDIDPWISSWFLAAPQGSYILSKIMNVISDPEQYYRFQGSEYFWFHRIVAQIANNDENVMSHITNYTSPWHCSSTGWKMRAPILKRCANRYMYHMLATHQRCCSTKQAGNQTTTAIMTTGEWGEICAQWNCNMVSVNLPLTDNVTRLYGGSKRLAMLKSVWYKGMELPPLPDPTRVSAPWNIKQLTTNAAESTAAGQAETRHASVKASTPSKIPRTIFMLSENGWPSNNARTNLIRRSFEIANPSFTIHALDGSEAERMTNRSDHVPDSLWNTLSVQYRSNVYRTILLYKYGGVWADFDVFCNRPLEDWLDLNSTDLVSFRREDNHDEQMERGISPWISSWFLAAPQGSYTISKIFNVISNSSELSHLKKQSFWWHRIVSDLANSDEEVHRRIQSYPPSSTCDGKLNAQTTILKQCAADRMTPIMATTEQCCQPWGLDSDKDNVGGRQRLTKLCAKWNCTTQTVNLRHSKLLKDFYGDRHHTLLQDFFSRNSMSGVQNGEGSVPARV